ncbi:hypothetical protein [Pseudomonas phage KPP25]|uniref:Uncharacterized protein n=1 Tax=Pseudomonas phage KPP25 TaxID=1462608 RepID=X5I398_BPKP2|nr:hypothetical protein FF13_gp67 [Pseudomonas phage KPP25]BAO58539.1 hypothetical protein [Pseudomonas phage KPP25]
MKLDKIAALPFPTLQGGEMKFDKIEYSVCNDCLLFVADGEPPENGADIEAAMRREIGEAKNAYFVCGVEPTEDDPDGIGENEFSWQWCELCLSTLGGSRYGVTLMIPLEEGTEDGSAEEPD